MFDTRDTPDSPPLDVSIRQANVEDAADIARVRLDTWRVAYRNLLPMAYLDRMSLEKMTFDQREHLALESQVRFIAESPAKPLGYCAAGRNRVPVEGYDGELFGLYVRPAFQKLGVGSRLFDIGKTWLKREGYNAMIVWVLRENPHRAFYEAKGGQLLTSTRMRVFSGKRMVEVAYGWRSL